VVFADETPARIDKERGIQRTWCKEQERWEEGVKHHRHRKDCALQFLWILQIQPQRPLPAYYDETEQEQEAAEVQLKQGRLINK
jgi:hypothetical protein